MTSIQWAERCSVNAHLLRPIETEAAALIWKKFKICLIALTRYHFLIIVFVNRFTHLHRIWITKWGTERGLWTFGIQSLTGMYPKFRTWVWIIYYACQHLFIFSNKPLTFFYQANVIKNETFSENLILVKYIAWDESSASGLMMYTCFHII